MMLQLVLASGADEEQLQRDLRRWADESRADVAGATRAFTSTAGLTGDGRAVVVTRGGGDPGTLAWWSSPDTCLPAPLTVLATTDVTAVEVGDAGEAGFVQVMRARVPDRARFEALEAEIGPAFVAFRPDFLAGFRAWFDDGTVAAVDYFRSEAEARAGESRDMPAELRAGFGEWLALTEGAEWYDLARPFQAGRR